MGLLKLLNKLVNKILLSPIRENIKCPKALPRSDGPQNPFLIFLLGVAHDILSEVVGVGREVEEREDLATCRARVRRWGACCEVGLGFRVYIGFRVGPFQGVLESQHTRSLRHRTGTTQRQQNMADRANFSSQHIS